MIANSSIQQRTVCLSLSLVDRCCLLVSCLCPCLLFLLCLCQCAFCLFSCLLWVCGFGWVVMVAVGGWSRVAGAWLRCVCVCVCVCLCVCLLCGAMSCRVSRVVVRYVLVVVRHWSLVVDCLSLSCALLLCVAVCGSVVLGERSEGVYASNASPCVRFERTHVFFSACHTTHRTAHIHHDHSHSHSDSDSHSDTQRQPTNNTNQPTCGSICLNTEKLTRSRHSKD